jgi:hypothetical protein
MRDAMSTADSSVGRKALLSLLHQATKGKKRNQDIDEKANQRPEINDCRDERSVAESSVGRQALSSLLKHANADTNMTLRKSSRRNLSENAVSTRKTRGVQGKKRPNDAKKSEDNEVTIAYCRDGLSLSHNQGDEETSVAASSVGRQALSSLLKHANADSNWKPRKSLRRKVSKNTVASRRAPTDVEGNECPKDANESEDDSVRIAAFRERSDALSMSGDQGDQETSVAASSLGRQALSSLLKHANADDNWKPRKSRRRKVSESAVTSRAGATDVGRNKCPQYANESEDDAVATAASIAASCGDRGGEVSVATSSVGRKALISLLKQAKNEAERNEQRA